MALAVRLLAAAALRVSPVALGPVPGRLAPGPWLAARLVGGTPGLAGTDVGRGVAVLGLTTVAQPLRGLPGAVAVLCLLPAGPTRLTWSGLLAPRGLLTRPGFPARVGLPVGLEL